MEWLAKQLGERFSVCAPEESHLAGGDSAYRFFELFDLPNIPEADALLERAATGDIHLTARKTHLQKKMLFALFWNQNLRDFWQRELGGKFMRLLEKVIPQTWLIDPAPLSARGYSRARTNDWRQLADLSQKDRQPILKLSGFNERAWGARSVRPGRISRATNGPPSSTKPSTTLTPLHGFYSVMRNRARFNTNGLILTESINPHDRPRSIMPVLLCAWRTGSEAGRRARDDLLTNKKIIHGMKDAILAPCRIAERN